MKDGSAKNINGARPYFKLAAFQTVEGYDAQKVLSVVSDFRKLVGAA